MVALSCFRRTTVIRRGRPVVLAGLALLLGGAGIRAETVCQQVSGYYTEQAVSGPDCLSPVGVCIAGTYYGGIEGGFRTTVSSFIPTADTPSTAVVLATADSTVQARVGRRSGTLIIKNAVALRTTGDGEIIDLQTITGGTGGLSGASGVLRAAGTYSADEGGRSIYTGKVCMP